MQKVKKYIIFAVLSFLIAGSSFASLNYLSSWLVVDVPGMILSLAAIVFLASVILLGFLIYESWLINFIFSVFAVAPVAVFIKISITSIIWMTATAFLFWWSGIEIQRASQNQMKINVRQLFLAGEMTMVTAVSLMIALFVYSGAAFGQADFSKKIYESTQGLVNRAVTWKFPDYDPGLSLDELMVVEYVKRIPVDQIPPEAVQLLKSKFGWDGKDMAGLLQNSQAREYLVREIASKMPKEALGGTYETIQNYTGIAISGRDKLQDVVYKFVNEMTAKFGQYIPPALAAMVFFLARFIGIIVGLLAIVLAGAFYLVLRLAKIITIKVEPRDKQIISF